MCFSCLHALSAAHSQAHVHPSVRPGACFASPAQGPPFPQAFSCQELGPAWTPSPMSLRGKPLGTGTLAPGCLPHSAPSMRDAGLLCLRMGSGLGWVPGLCTGETPQETGLAKWPPFPFSSLGHDCAVSLPEEAQGGRPPFWALSASGWCPQTLRRQGWTGPNGKVGGQGMCVFVYGETGGTEPTFQWWTPPDLGAEVLPVYSVLISISLPVSAWFVMTV